MDAQAFKSPGGDCTSPRDYPDPMHHLTIRNVPPDLASALQAARRARGISLNGVVLELLAASLGVTPAVDNGLARRAGTWTDEEADRFSALLAEIDPVDPELWR